MCCKGKVNREKKRNPLKGTNPNLETDTLRRYKTPLLIITYKGIKKAIIEQIDTYELYTSAGTLHKTAGFQSQGLHWLSTFRYGCQW